MGNQLNCLAQCHASHEDRQRLLTLQKGAYFARKKQVLGLNTGSERILLRLSSDEQSLLWNVHDSIKDPARIELSAIDTVQARGALGLSITSRKGDALLEVEAEGAAVRDEWVASLQLLIEGDCAAEESAEETSESKPKLRQVLEERAQKQAYWAKRTQELEDRKRDAEERKKRFAGAGMRYTALAMSNRASGTGTAASAAE